MKMPRNKAEIDALAFEIRALPVEEGSDSRWLEGYAARFDGIAKIPWGDGTSFEERIDPKAFNNADMRDVVLLVNHNFMMIPAARTRNKSLTLELDNVGLKMRADVGQTEAGREFHKAVELGLIDQMSITFKTSPKNGSVWSNDYMKRDIVSIEKVFDVSGVTFPAYTNTSLTASRCAETVEEEVAELRKVRQRDDDIRNQMKIRGRSALR
jgi:HK97 family phage prohead protease